MTDVKAEDRTLISAEYQAVSSDRWPAERPRPVHLAWAGDKDALCGVRRIIQVGLPQEVKATCAVCLQIAYPLRRKRGQGWKAQVVGLAGDAIGLVEHLGTVLNDSDVIDRGAAMRRRLEELRLDQSRRNNI